MVNTMAKKDFVHKEVDKLKKEVNRLNRRVQPAIRDGRHTLELGIEEGRHKFEEGREFVVKEEKEVEIYIKKNPMKSVAVAFMVGLFIGKMK